ncbi:MAG: ABC transporter ATP-binding protein [Chloracidobacterium sp.]|uniref:ABC transporter ATP-binding protein n=1 Tax=Chloracidobacterium validum TaxID=2821543 RepID=A0ABX8BE81_9BACT|nr:ABC transporter ATP-binding protein [Chloracidobacterium validum]QUW03375.1 ABC transporter ATP-binding protein [Chloracidobacterium validum]
MVLAVSSESPLLATKATTVRFGGIVAVKDLDLTVPSNQVFGLIGPNGAGKTTVFNILTGVYRPTSGDVQFEGRSIVGLPPHAIAQLGLARTFQNIRLFGELSVLENVMTACHPRSRSGVLATMFRTRRQQSEEREQRDFALALLERFGLAAQRHAPAKSLAYGNQRRLEIARALATRPKALLLDEPAAGMNPQESVALMRQIQQLRDDFKLTIVLVEHNMRVVMGACERIQVVEQGQTIAIGSPDDIKRDPRVIAAYLGTA